MQLAVSSAPGMIRFSYVLAQKRSSVTTQPQSCICSTRDIFALETQAEEIAKTIRKFLARRLDAVDGRKK